MKGTPDFPQCGFSAAVVQVLSHVGVKFKGVNVLTDPEVREGIKAFANWPTIPQLYVNGEFVGGSDIMREMMAGSIHLGLTPFDVSGPMVAAGKVRAIAVTGVRRQKAYPDVPSLAEAGYKGLQDDDPYAMYGLVGPAGMPAAAVSTLTGVMNKVAKNPEFETFMQEKFGAEPATASAAARLWTAINRFAMYLNLEPAPKGPT